MLKLVVIGAGSHSQRNHLPSLARYVALHPGQVELAGLCDLRRAHAEEMAARYGFSRVYVDLDEMLRVERPDGCVAVTPIPVTAQIAARVIEAGVPLLMEKPPGATADEAQQIVQLVERSAARVMVSMNRRYDPALRAALRWWGDRPIRYIRATISRVDRREPDFVYGTAIHPLDTLRAIAGDVCAYEAESREVDGVRWVVARFVFECGALGVLEVLPTAGAMAESYYVAMAPHNYNSTSVGLAATLHAAACMPNFLITEYFLNFSETSAEVATGAFAVEDGYISLPTALGLGIDLIEEKLLERPGREAPLRRFGKYQ